MEEKQKFAYFYSYENKSESFGVVTRAHNWGKPKSNTEAAVREILPKNVEEFCILQVEESGKMQFGSFLADMLSINFSEAIDFFREGSSGWLEELDQEDLCLLPKDIRLLTLTRENKGKTIVGKDILDDVKRLYIIRKYVEMCIENPKLYSFGQFQLLLDTVCKEEWHLKPLGFFVPIDTFETNRYFFYDRDFPKASYYDSASFHRYDLSGLGSHLEDTLLGHSSRNNLPDTTIEVFEISNTVDAVLLSLFHLIQEQTAIKKCANCSKLFVPLARADAIYCDRAAPQDESKTCKAYGSKVLWYENIVSDDVTKLARNIYCSKQMLTKRNPDKREYADMFAFFKTEKKKWEREIKSGTKTREEYAEWLRKMKLCKTKAELEES